MDSNQVYDSDSERETHLIPFSMLEYDVAPRDQYGGRGARRLAKMQ